MPAEAHPRDDAPSSDTTDTGDTRNPSEDEAARTETITFAHGPLSVMVSISHADGTHARLDGWITSGDAEVHAVAPGGTLSVVADGNGRFVLDRVPRGPVRLVVRTASPDGPRSVTTPTIDL